MPSTKSYTSPRSVRETKTFGTCRNFAAKNRSCAPILSGTNLVYTASDKADLLATTFSRAHFLTTGLRHRIDSVVNTSINTLRNTQRPSLDAATLSSPDELKTIIKSLRSFKAPGADNLQNVLLKHLPTRAISYLTQHNK